MKAAHLLLKQAGVTALGAAVVVELNGLGGRELLEGEKLPFFSVVALDEKE